MTLSAALQDSTEASERVQEMISDVRYRTVLKTLAQYKSMPFLELTSISDIDDDMLQKIISDFEKEELVKVSNADNVFEEIVTLRDKGFGLA